MKLSELIPVHPEIAFMRRDSGFGSCFFSVMLTNTLAHHGLSLGGLGGPDSSASSSSKSEAGRDAAALSTWSPAASADSSNASCHESSIAAVPGHCVTV